MVFDRRDLWIVLETIPCKSCSWWRSFASLSKSPKACWHVLTWPFHFCLIFLMENTCDHGTLRWIWSWAASLCEVNQHHGIPLSPSFLVGLFLQNISLRKGAPTPGLRRPEKISSWMKRSSSFCYFFFSSQLLKQMAIETVFPDFTPLLFSFCPPRAPPIP